MMFVVQNFNVDLYDIRILFYEMLNVNCLFDLISTGDWLYMLFMHQACVCKTKYQYMKSNEIRTTVIKGAYQNDCISDILKESIEAFQVKINLKQEYLAYYLWKKFHNCYDAMTTSPVESINCHIKHKTEASTLNNTSRSLLLITEGADSRIAGIDKSAQRELQVTVLLSKLTVRNLYL